MELVDGFPRTLCGIFYQAMFAVGVLFDGFVAYLLPDWRWLTWLSGVATFLFIPFYWWACHQISLVLVRANQSIMNPVECIQTS